MFEKLKDRISKNSKIEKLISFLAILVITLIIINIILKEENKENPDKNQTLEFVKVDNENKVNDLEERLEKILSNMQGVGEVEVLITYSESESINPLYNENSSSSTTQEDSKITETQNISKEIIIDNSSNPILQNTSSPIVEGSVIIAEGANLAETKNNIISAVEAATGLPTHKIQVFEMKK